MTLRDFTMSESHDLPLVTQVLGGSFIFALSRFSVSLATSASGVSGTVSGNRQNLDSVEDSNLPGDLGSGIDNILALVHHRRNQEDEAEFYVGDH